MAEQARRPAFELEFPGPFEQHEVVVNGWKVPLLEAQLARNDGITIVLDSRYGLELTTEEAERVVPFLAHGIAIALGFNSHPSSDDEQLPAREPHPRPQRVHSILGFGGGDE